MIKNRTGKGYIPFITGIDYSTYFFFILESISLYDPGHRIPRKFLLFQMVYNSLLSHMIYQEIQTYTFLNIYYCIHAGEHKCSAERGRC